MIMTALLGRQVACPTREMLRGWGGSTPPVGGAASMMVNDLIRKVESLQGAMVLIRRDSLIEFGFEQGRGSTFNYCSILARGSIYCPCAEGAGGVNAITSAVTGRAGMKLGSWLVGAATRRDLSLPPLTHLELPSSIPPPIPTHLAH